MEIRNKNITKYEAFLRKPSMGRYIFLPSRVCLYLTRACNLSCPNCTYSSNKYFNKAKYLSVEQFEKILAVTGNYAAAFGFGGGEPLLNRDAFKIMNMAGTINGAAVAINTNGLLLGKHMEQMLECRTDRVQVSFDAIDDTGYQRERHGKPGDFEKLKKNVKDLLLNRDPKRTKLVTISFLLHTGNVSEISDMISFAEELGVDQVGFHNVNNHMDDGYQPLRKENKEVVELLNKLMKKKYKVNIFLPALIEDRVTLCPMTFKDIYINDEMCVSPCCHIMDFEFSELKDDLEESWRNEKLNKFRETFLQGSLPSKICTNCHRRFAFYGTYNLSTGWLKNNWYVQQFRKIIKYSPVAYSYANKLRHTLNANLKNSKSSI